MNSEFDHVPSHLFDRMEKYPFSALSETEQQEVLNYFTREDYDEMHRSLQLVKEGRADGKASVNAPRKGELMAAFHQKHAAEKEGGGAFFLLTGVWGKVAAALLLLGCGWALNDVFPFRSQTSQQSLTYVDTLYISREVPSPAIKIFDTVYIEASPKLYSAIPSNKMQRVNPQNYSGKRFEFDPGAEVLSVSEINSAANRQKNNSIKDDSLMKRYTVVSM